MVPYIMFISFCITAVGTMPQRMANAAKLWKEADKEKFKELVGNIPRNTVETLDDAGRKTYIHDQLKTIQSSVCVFRYTLTGM